MRFLPNDGLSWFERAILPLIFALVLFGIFTTMAFAQTPRELARDIERLERQIIGIQALLTSNTIEDTRARQDGFTRLAVLESQVNELRITARENRQLFFGTLATIIGNIFLSVLTFNRLRRNGRNASA